MLNYLCRGKKGFSCFSYGAITPHKNRNCNKRTEDILCGGCDEIVNEKEEFSESLYQLKRQTCYEFGHILPKFVTT